MNEEWIFVGEFAAKVIGYLRLEWGVELAQFQEKFQEEAFRTMAEMKGKQSVPNIAAKIAETLPSF